MFEVLMDRKTNKISEEKSVILMILK